MLMSNNIKEFRESLTNDLDLEGFQRLAEKFKLDSIIAQLEWQQYSRWRAQLKKINS